MTYPDLSPRSNHGYRAAGAILITVILWGLAVVLPVWQTRSNQSGEWAVVAGNIPALIGFLGLLVYCPAWFANLLLIPLCIMLFKGSKAGFPLSVFAFALAATAYAFPAIYGDNDQAVIMQRLIGFYLWLGSFLTMTLAHAFLTQATERRRTVTRFIVIGLMVCSMIVLEIICSVGANALETSLKNPNDLTGFTKALANHPSQEQKDTALRWAVRQDLSSAQRIPSKRITMLIAAGADPNKPDKYGTTLLMQALQARGPEAFIELLVQAGADVNARDHRGKNVLDIAQESGISSECQKILLNAGARPSTQPKQ